MNQARGIGGHQSTHMRSEDWITPRWIFDALGMEFDLDPCACTSQPWPTAKEMWAASGGLDKAWRGQVWLNPPYGKQARMWMARMAKHGQGMALIFARTDTRMFYESVWAAAHAILFLQGRLTFHYPSGRRADNDAGAPSVLVAYGMTCTAALSKSGIKGGLVTPFCQEPAGLFHKQQGV